MNTFFPLSTWTCTQTETVGNISLSAIDMGVSSSVAAFIHTHHRVSLGFGHKLLQFLDPLFPERGTGAAAINRRKGSILHTPEFQRRN